MQAEQIKPGNLCQIQPGGGRAHGLHGRSPRAQPRLNRGHALARLAGVDLRQYGQCLGTGHGQRQQFLRCRNPVQPRDFSSDFRKPSRGCIMQQSAKFAQLLRLIVMVGQTGHHGIGQVPRLHLCRCCCIDNRGQPGAAKNDAAGITVNHCRAPRIGICDPRTLLCLQRGSGHQIMADFRQFGVLRLQRSFQLVPISANGLQRFAQIGQHPLKHIDPAFDQPHQGHGVINGRHRRAKVSAFDHGFACTVGITRFQSFDIAQVYLFFTGGHLSHIGQCCRLEISIGCRGIGVIVDQGKAGG